MKLPTSSQYTKNMGYLKIYIYFFKTLPRFSLSIALLLPAYVGLISFPNSSMIARSSAYLLCGT